MRASWLGTKEVLGMVERNYRVYCAMNSIPLDETEIGEDEQMDTDEGLGPADEEEEWGGTPSFFKEEAARIAREQPVKTKSKRKKTRVAELVREKIRKVLEDVTELADKRSGKCDENDFLKLLYAFNQEDIHFA